MTPFDLQTLANSQQASRQNHLLLKTVLIGMKNTIQLATLQWVSWFNHHRLLEPIGYIPPAEAEENYYRQLASQAAVPA